MPRGVRKVQQRVSDMVADFIPFMRYRLTAEESDLAVHLRGNTALLESLISVIRSKIEDRARMPEPSDPLVCKSMMARDRELQELINRLNHLSRSPLETPADDRGEQPA